MAALTATLETRLKDAMLSLTLTVDEELLALVGRTGAGKSITLRSIAGVYVPDAGVVKVREETVFSSGLDLNVPPQERHIGFIPQLNQLFPHLTVEENVGFSINRRRDVSEQTAREGQRRIRELIELLRLTNVRDAFPAELSDMQRLRAAFGRALVLDPEVLLLDDPFAALDEETRRQARIELMELRKLIRVPMLFATSELEEAYEIADRIALLEHGQLLQTATPRQLLMRPASRQVAEIVRSVNVIAGRVIGSNDGVIEVSTPIGRLQVRDLSGIHGAVDVVIRPEHIRPLERNEVPDTEGSNVLHGMIVHDVNHGSIHQLTFEPDDGYQNVALQVFVTDLAHEQLGLSASQHRSMELPPRALHLMPRSDDTGRNDDE